jgi:predicted secreted Zn-dependent protease
MPDAMHGSSLITWRRTSFCQGGECVEVAIHDEMILVRDSKDLAQAPLQYTQEEWRAFIEGVKAEQFDTFR